jgi:hypothetical protein
MEEKEILSYQELGVRVSRLIELIAMTNHTIQVHKEGGDSPLYVRQYEELLERHITELKEMMQVVGFSVQLSPIEMAA